jgi:c-di-GMP-binding flagellar brake protein YcgR
MDGNYFASSAAQRRDSLRRAVRLSTEVRSRAWRNATTLTATDVSEHGMWLRSEKPLSIGEELSVVFRMPECGAGTGESVAALARVVRAADSCGCALCAETAGMGVRFVALSAAHREALQAALRGLPPPLPRAHCIPEGLPHDKAQSAACAQWTSLP